MSKVVDDGPAQFVGFGKYLGVHDLSCSRIDGLAVALEGGLARYAEHLADLLPRAAPLPRLLHSRGHPRLSRVLHHMRRVPQLERLVLATSTAERREGTDCVRTCRSRGSSVG